MNFLKLAIVGASIAIFISACGQAATNGPSNAGNAAKTVIATPGATTANSVGTVSTPLIADAPNEELASSKEIYAANCMICHKDTGKGGKVTIEGKNLNVDDLTSANLAKKSDDKLYGYISDGSPDDGMPSFADKLKPDEIKAVIAHVRTLQKR